MSDSSHLTRFLEETESYWQANLPLLGHVWDVLAAGELDILPTSGSGLAAQFAHVRLDPRIDLEATWGRIETFKALPLFSRPPRSEEVSDMLGTLARWAGVPSTDDASLSVSWPAIDESPFPDDVGFTCLTGLAARHGALAEDGRGRGLRAPCKVAPIERASDCVVGLWHDLVLEEERWGAVFPREGTRSLLSRRLSKLAHNSLGLVFEAQVEGRSVGFIAGHWAEALSSVSRRVSIENLFYVDALYVEPGFRGRGIGTTLFNRLSRGALERQTGGFALHYSEASPNSGSFWRAAGFKTVWSTWRRDLAKANGAAGHAPL